MFRKLWERIRKKASCPESGNDARSLRKLYARYPDYSGLRPEDNDVYGERFDQLLTELFIDYFGRVSPIRRHEVLSVWNFDHPKAILEWVVSQADTDIATAQMIYWRMEPESVRECEAEEDLPILEIVEQKIGQGFYQDNGIAYDPRDDYGDAVETNTVHTPENSYPAELLKSRPGRQFAITGILADSIPEELYPAYSRLVRALGQDM